MTQQDSVNTVPSLLEKVDAIACLWSLWHRTGAGRVEAALVEAIVALTKQLSSDKPPQAARSTE